MGIRLVFTIQREAFYLDIIGKEIFYGDRIWKNKIRIVPKDEGFEMKIRMSRNKYPNLNMKTFNDFFNFTDEERKEYDDAKDEKELADICRTILGCTGPLAGDCQPRRSPPWRACQIPMPRVGITTKRSVPLSTSITSTPSREPPRRVRLATQ